MITQNEKQSNKKNANKYIMPLGKQIVFTRRADEKEKYNSQYQNINDNTFFCIRLKKLFNYNNASSAMSFSSIISSPYSTTIIIYSVYFYGVAIWGGLPYRGKKVISDRFSAQKNIFAVYNI